MKKYVLVPVGLFSVLLIAMGLLFRIDNTNAKSSLLTQLSEENTENNGDLDPTKATLTGKILDDAGNPLKLIRINLEGQNGNFDSVSDMDGTYYVFDITPGSYTVEIIPPPFTIDYTAQKFPAITLEAGETHEQNFQFAKSGAVSKSVKATVKRQNGQAISDAQIIAIKNATRTITMKDVDTSGVSSFNLTGGTWLLLAVPQNRETAKWTRALNVEIAKFEENDTAETKEVDFIVAVPDAKITGSVKNSDGSSPAAGTIVTVSNGLQYQKTTDSSGNFSIDITEGTYSLSVSPADTKYSAPETISVAVTSGQTYDAGTIQLIRDTGKIKGTVKNKKSGQGVSDATVTVSMPETNNFQTVKTNSSGSYEVSVSGGDWLVSIEPPAGKYIAEDNNLLVNVIEKQTKTVDFSCRPQPATVSGKVLNEKGKAVTDVEGYILATNADGENFSGTISQGFFSFTILPGSYNVDVTLAPDSPYSPEKDVKLTVGETDVVKTVNLNVKSNKYEISGVINDDSGKKVTGVKIKVFASDSEGSWQETETKDGTYSINVSSGAWNIGYSVVDDNTGTASSFLPPDPSETSLNVEVKKNVTKNLVLKRASSTLTGKILDPDGKPMPNVYVSIDAMSASTENKETGKTFVTSTETDSQGNFSTLVPPGTYYLHSYQQTKKGLINPDEKAVTVAGGQSQNIALNFSKAESEINGKVLTADGKAAALALVSAWSENGGYVETKSDKTGTYRLPVSADDTWHVSSSLDMNGKGYVAAGVEMPIEEAGKLNLDLKVIPASISLDPPVAQSTSATAGAAMQMKDGAKIMMPSNATDVKGKMTLAMTETMEASGQGTSNILGSAYNIELRDSKGVKITDLMQPMVLTFPFDKNALKGVGAKPQNLIPSYWDPGVGTWKKLENVVIDKNKGVITAKTNHMTRFALVSPADETPPPAPTSVSVKSENNKLVLNWTAPNLDFHHVKIYRSEKARTAGTLAADNVTGNKYEFSAETGKTYYFTVRSVDLAGNESKNTDQVSLGGGKVKRK